MRTRKTIVILISGKAGSGKSTVGDLVTKKISMLSPLTVFRYSFAGPLKEIATKYVQWDGQKDEGGRKLLQELGRVGRDYNKDTWVKLMLKRIDETEDLLPYNFVVVDDWRFPNELAFLQNEPMFEVVKVRVIGHQVSMPGNTASDVSENSLPEGADNLYDYVIENRSDISELDNKVDEMLSSITKQYIVE